MIPVVVDGRPLQPGFKAHRERGIGRYSKNLLAAMLGLPAPPRVELLLQEGLADPGLFGELPRRYTGVAPGWLPVGKRLLTQHLLARRALAPVWRRGRVVHFLSHLDAPLRLGPRTVITVHDLIAQKLARLYAQGKSDARFRLERWLETRCLYQASRIIAVSECTRSDLVELYRLDPGRIVVIPEAADPALAPVEDPAVRTRVLSRQGLEAARPFFLYLGGIDQRKDLDTLLGALARLRDQGRDCLLALAGKIRDDRQYPALRRAVRRQGLEERVRELGYVPDQDLPALFSACAAFVFPSRYEGFGLPPLEAMACGAPVVAAAGGAVPEVVGDAGILVPPGRPEELAAAMARILEDEGLARELRRKGLARARGFSWERTARQTLAVYEEVARER